MTDGIAGLVFMDDIITLIKNNWTSNGGKLPVFTKKWETKEFGFGTNNDEKIVITLDGENPEIFSLKYHDGEGNPIYDWLHTVSVSADVWTGKSEDRVLEMVGEIVRILKNTVVPLIGNNQYIQMLPTNISSALEQYRNIYRYVIDIEVMRLNP